MCNLCFTDPNVPLEQCIIACKRLDVSNLTKHLKKKHMSDALVQQVLAQQKYNEERRGKVEAALVSANSNSIYTHFIQSNHLAKELLVQ